MTTSRLNLRNVATIVACLAVTTMFASCDETNGDDDGGGGNGGGAKKTVEVSAQIGTMTAGVAGTVTYAVTTKNIANGDYDATVDNRPAGVTVQGKVTINSGSGTLTLAGSTSTKVGETKNLTLTIDKTKSAVFALNITEGRSLNANEKELVGKYSYGSSGSGYWTYYSYGYDQWKDAYSFAHGINFKSDGTFEGFQFQHGSAFTRGGSLIKVTAKWKISTKGTVTFSDYVNNIRYADGTTRVQNMSDKTEYPNWNPDYLYTFEKKDGKEGIRWKPSDWIGDGNFYEKE